MATKAYPPPEEKKKVKKVKNKGTHYPVRQKDGQGQGQDGLPVAEQQPAQKEGVGSAEQAA